MLNSLPKIPKTAKDLAASPKIGHNMAATLGVKRGSLNFQQLMTSSLGVLPNSHKKGTASLSFLNSMAKQFADFRARGLEHSELLSIKQVAQSFKEQAGKSQKPLAFQYNSKFLGKISFEIEPVKNRLKVGLDEEQLKTSDRLIAELTPLFGQVELGSVFGFQQSAFSSQFSAINPRQSTVSNQLSARNFQQLALDGQLSATQAFGVIKEWVEVSNKLPVKANDPGQKVELNVESIGKISIDFKTVNGKLLVQVGLPSRQTLDNFKTGFLKSTGFTEDSLKFIIAKPEQAAPLVIQTSDKLIEIKKGLVRDRQIPKVSMRHALETIQRRIAEVRGTHAIVKNPRQLLNLNIDALGKVSVEIDSGQGKIKLKADVSSQSAGKVLRKQLSALVVKASDLKIFIRNAGENAGKRVSSFAPLANSGAKIKPSQAVEIVEKVIKSVAAASQKVSSKLKFGLQTDSLGDIEADVETSAGKTSVKLNVDSDSARNLLSKRLGRKIQNLEIRVTEVSTSQKIKGFQGQFKLNSKLTTSQAIQSIREVVESISQISSKAGQNQIQVQMEVENFGKIAVAISKNVEDGNVLLQTNSSPARDWLTQHLAKSGLKVKEVKTGKNKGALNLKLDSRVDETLETAAKEKPILQPKESTQPTALKKFTELIEVLLGPATPVKNRSNKLSNNRLKPSNKLDKGKVSVRGKDSRQDRGILAQQENKFKLKNDLSNTREFLGEILENIEGDSAEYIDPNLSESEHAIQPVLTSNNVNFDVLGGKLMASGTVERSHLPQMIKKILELTSSQSNTGRQKLQIQLDVEKLGSFLIDAVKHKDKINLHINVDNSEVRRMLESQLRPLLDQMLKEGIEVGKLEVSVKNEKSDNADEWQTAENEREFREQNLNSEHPVSAYAKETLPISRQRDFGYNSIEVLA
ncbi:MAG: flagellar hook-length control protein FliK [Caldithrix sp.]|nr:MAG: flagellar hook-length control protein FliK [Caldithrix sp.]TDJ00568.1 MAG: flagellar hook-length control protein FliK [Caldithrix sp.]